MNDDQWRRLAQPPAVVVGTEWWEAIQRRITVQTEPKPYREYKIYSPDEDLRSQPTDMASIGGPDGLRYVLRMSEIRNHIADLLDKLEEVEANDALYFGESDEHFTYLTDWDRRLDYLSKEISREAPKARRVVME